MDLSSKLSSGANDTKGLAIRQIQVEIAMANARALVSKINENCFEKCVPAMPGASQTHQDETCLKSCMEKYLQAWNTVNRAYMARATKMSGTMASATATTPATSDAFTADVAEPQPKTAGQDGKKSGWWS